MNKKRLWAFGLSLVAATALASTYAIIKPQPLSPSSSDSSIITQANSVRVAIVNEDTGTNYNGQDLKISETLINSYQSQLNYPMEVVSRATAEKGLESGLYQLMIVFPSKFSEV